jgi:GMP synthase (glutamine-hydrolysing)
VQRAIGDRLTCVYVDHGLMREGETEQIERDFVAVTGADLRVVDAREQFLAASAGISDPERSARPSAGSSSGSSSRPRSTSSRREGARRDRRLPRAGHALPRRRRVRRRHRDGEHQEPPQRRRAAEDLQFTLVEPLRTLFKDEVREVGVQLGLPEAMVWRQPFPGPGLGIRIVGEVTQERLDVLRRADAIVRAELSAAGLDREIWQCPVVLLADVRSVGVQGDGRTYGHPIVLRPVSSEDAMTADWTRLPYDLLARISTRITNEVPEVNRVVLDVTSKPPGTIEWE